LTRSHRLPGNRDDEFKILKYHDKTPVLAGCEHCRVKFFAPSEKMKDIESAEKYLREKYLLHDCERAQWKLEMDHLAMQAWACTVNRYCQTEWLSGCAEWTIMFALSTSASDLTLPSQVSAAGCPRFRKECCAMAKALSHQRSAWWFGPPVVQGRQSPFWSCRRISRSSSSLRCFEIAMGTSPKLLRRCECIATPCPHAPRVASQYRRSASALCAKEATFDCVGLLGYRTARLWSGLSRRGWCVYTSSRYNESPKLRTPPPTVFLTRRKGVRLGSRKAETATQGHESPRGSSPVPGKQNKRSSYCLFVRLYCSSEFAHSLRKRERISSEFRRDDVGCTTSSREIATRS